MDCNKIENIISELKADSLGRIRNKNKVIDKLHSESLKEVDSLLMDIRVYVAQLSTGYSSTQVLQMVDNFLYKKQL